MLSASSNIASGCTYFKDQSDLEGYVESQQSNDKIRHHVPEYSYMHAEVSERYRYDHEWAHQSIFAKRKGLLMASTE